MLVLKLAIIFISFISIRFIHCNEDYDEEAAFGKMIDDLTSGDNIFSNSETDFNGADLNEADFNGADFNEADFNGTNSDFDFYQNTDFESFIVNGEDASKGEYPWFTTVSIIKGNYISTICGGTLINKNWILTAAHCIERYKFGIEVGKYKAGVQAAFRYVDYVCRHKFYNRANIDNDIALMYFKNPITNIKPIRITYPQTHNYDVIGFGSTSESASGGYPTILQKASVYKVDRDQCAKKWGDELVDNRKFCASGYGKQDSCVGDSGGPLLMKTQNGIKQVGLVSFGPVPCNDRDYPVIYTRLTPMLSWIKKVMNGDKSQCTIIRG